MHFIYTKNGVQYCIDDQYICDTCINIHHQNFKYKQLLFCVIFIGIIVDLILIKTPFSFINIITVISLPYLYLYFKKKVNTSTGNLNNNVMIIHCIDCGHTNINL